MPISGKTCNEACPSCSHGRLQPVMRKAQAGVTSSGVKGQPIYVEVIERLACGSCAASYEAAHRGQTIEDVLVAQLDSVLEAPDAPSASCTKCAGTLHRGADLDASEVPSLVPHHFRPYRYCRSCLIVAWCGEPRRGGAESSAFAAWLNDGHLS